MNRPTNSPKITAVSSWLARSVEVNWFWKIIRAKRGYFRLSVWFRPPTMAHHPAIRRACSMPLTSATARSDGVMHQEMLNKDGIRQMVRQRTCASLSTTPERAARSKGREGWHHKHKHRSTEHQVLNHGRTWSKQLPFSRTWTRFQEWGCPTRT